MIQFAHPFDVGDARTEPVPKMYDLMFMNEKSRQGSRHGRGKVFVDHHLQAAASPSWNLTASLTTA
jgi:hypothetical protein